MFPWVVGRFIKEGCSLVGDCVWLQSMLLSPCSIWLCWLSNMHDILLCPVCLLGIVNWVVCYLFIYFFVFLYKQLLTVMHWKILTIDTSLLIHLYFAVASLICCCLLTFYCSLLCVVNTDYSALVLITGDFCSLWLKYNAVHILSNKCWSLLNMRLHIVADC